MLVEKWRWNQSETFQRQLRFWMHVRSWGWRMGYSVHAGCKLSGTIELEMSWQDTESWIGRVEYRKWHEILIYSNIGGGCYHDNVDWKMEVEPKWDIPEAVEVSDACGIIGPANVIQCACEGQIKWWYWARNELTRHWESDRESWVQEVVWNINLQ